MDRRFLAIAPLAVLAGCGGGGSSRAANPVAPAVPIVAPTPAAVTGSSARFVLKVPARAASARARQPKYVATNTASVRFTVLTVNGSPTGNPPGTVVPLDNSVCTTNADSSRTCTLNVAAPVGSDDISVETFADTSGTQNVGSGIVNVQVALNSTNTTGLTLSGALDHVALQTTTAYLGNPYPYNAYYSAAHRLVRGTTSFVRPNAASAMLTSTRLYVMAFDAQNNLILDPTPFATPITLGVSRPDAIQLSVTHQDGSSGGSTTAAPVPSQSATPPPSTSWPTVSVTATTDVIKATVASGWMNPWIVVPYYSTYQNWPVIAELYAWIGSPTAVATPPNFSRYYSPQTSAGQQAGSFYPNAYLTMNVPNTSSPPAPCAPGYVQTSTTAGSCSTPSISLSANDTTSANEFSGGYSYAYYQFSSAGDSFVPTIKLTSNDITFSGTYSVTPQSGNPSGCPTTSQPTGTTLQLTPKGNPVAGTCYYVIANGEATATLYAYVGTPTLQWSTSPLRMSGYGFSTGRVQFGSLTDPTVITVYFTNNDAHAPTTAGSGGPTFIAVDATNGTACGTYFAFTDLTATPQSINMATGWTPASTWNGSRSEWAFNVKITGTPTAAHTCKIMVVSSGTAGATTYDGVAASLEFDINNLIGGGTIQ